MLRFPSAIRSAGLSARQVALARALYLMPGECFMEKSKAIDTINFAPYTGFRPADRRVKASARGRIFVKIIIICVNAFTYIGRYL